MDYTPPPEINRYVQQEKNHSFVEINMSDYIPSTQKYFNSFKWDFEDMPDIQNLEEELKD